MRPDEIVKENHLDSRPCLYSGTANASDVCQVWFLFSVGHWTCMPSFVCVITLTQVHGFDFFKLGLIVNETGSFR